MEHSPYYPYSVGNEGREIFWNVGQYELLLYFLSLVALAIMSYGFYRRWLMWKALGKPETENRFADLKERIKYLFCNVLLQRNTFKDTYPGVMHGLIFFGFLVLFMGAVFDATEHHITDPLFGWVFLKGTFYLVFNFLLEVFGLAVLIGCLMALSRRYLTKPDRLATKGVPDNKPEDAIILGLLVGIIVTGFIVEALRLQATRPPWEMWHFVGWTVSQMFVVLNLETTQVLHKITWWVHTFLALGFIAYIPYSKLLHIFTTPANQYMKTMQPVGQIEPIRDFENAETFGVGQLQDFTWKQIFDSDACTQCGRCQDGCPAHLSGKPLSPKKLTQDIKSYWLEKAPAAVAELKAKAAGEGEGEEDKRNIFVKWLHKLDAAVDGYMKPPDAPKAEGEGEEKPMVGEVIDLHELWSCTNCMYCMENCPADIEHVPKVVGMRQYKVLMEADFAPELQLTFRNMENNSNPWGIGAHLRADWAKDLDIKTLAEDADVEYLFYVGCSGSFDDRGKKVTIAFAKILKAAGVSFGILGTEEGCCGDSAMRGGNEYLYQTMAQMNIEVMDGYGVKKIITICPHGYNAIKKDYPHFGGKYEVYHHTEIIADLIAKGKISLKAQASGLFTYHDSCFLGRYNDIYNQPRRVLKAIPGLRLTEMDRAEAKSFCCGAGGARMWMEEDIGERINDMRTDQAIAVGADKIAVACPFCLTMMTDGIKDRSKEESMVALDIAEIVWEAMGLEDKTAAPPAAEQ